MSDKENWTGVVQSKRLVDVFNISEWSAIECICKNKTNSIIPVRLGIPKRARTYRRTNFWNDLGNVRKVEGKLKRNDGQK